jgi:ParB family chromosome partitioning protein
VTLKAYEKAGGALRRDLFSDDDKKVYLLDAALLENLATDKLQKRAKQIAAEGWKWVDVRVRYAFDEYVKYGELRKSKRQPDADEAAHLADLDGRIAALHAQMEALAEALADEDGNEEAFYRLEGETEGLEEQRKALDEALSVWPANLMAQAGCVVHVGTNGAVAVKCGLIRPDDRSDMVQAARQAAENGTDEPLVSLPSPKTRPVHSEKLVRCLTAHRVAAVQAELLDRPDVALAAITAHLAQKIFRGNDLYYCRSENVFAINATDSQSELRSAAEDMEASAAWAKIQTERTVWAERLPEKLEEIFPWLLGQEQATVLRLLTFVGAVTVTGLYGTEPERQSNEALARALGLDMTQWWTATGASYFHHVSKARVLEVVTEAVDANAASPLAALKKDAVVTGAEQTVARTGWLPAVLRVQTLPTAGECSESLQGEEEEPALAG